MSEQAPTILIGLGGIGSQIANKVYGEIPEENRGNVAIHAFDTDVNSIKKLEHIGKHVTQTSTRRSVGQYLHQYPSLSKWFPDHPELLKKTMTQGAGQVRAVSRLAFMSAIAEGKLNQVMEDIEGIFPVNSGKYEQGVRVIIITTLAGGTGSGIFLQVALYLRKLLQERFGERVLVRGAFMLPDVLTRTSALDPTEWDSVRANGYACLKELEAITQSIQNKGNDGVTINLEYRPNQVDINNRVDHAVTEKPYDFGFLYDYENTRGQHLDRVSDYIDQMSRSIYLQLFSPISDKHFSQEDNQIKQLIDSEGKGIYCGSGVTTLTYPFEEILEYLALNWSVLGLDQNWLKLDELFDEEKQQYDEDLRNGIQREKINKGKSYINHMKQLGSERFKDADPFFREMINQVYERLEDNKHGKLKSIKFIEAIEEHIEHTLNNDEELRLNSSLSMVDDELISSKESAIGEISDTESRLRYYKELIEKKVYEYRTMITHQVIFQDHDATNKAKGNSFSLNTWILKEDGPLHPVSTRFFLYDVFEQITNRLGKLRTDNSELKKKIDSYVNKYDDSETEEFETAEMRMNKALEQGFIGSLLNNQFKSFVKDYKINSNQQLQSLNRYKKNLLLELVYQSILEDLQSLIDIYEKFFENLKDTKVSLANSINQKAKQFEHTADPTKEYVLATKELQDKLWERVRNAETDDLLPDDVSQQIYVNLYDEFYKKEKSRFETEQQAMDVEEFYRNHVLDHCFNKLKYDPVVNLDYDVISALRKEAELLNVDPDAHIQERIKAMDNLALPFIPNMNDRRELKFWGIHDDSSRQLSEVEATELFEEDAIVDQAFSKYEVTCYRAHYGLEAHHFNKFSNGEKSSRHTKFPGAYYEAYYKTIKKLNRNEPAVTPHLDKNWHLPIYMPDINPSHKELDNQKVNRAFLLGLIYDWFQVVKDEGRYVFLYREDGHDRIILKGGSPVGHQLNLLRTALQYNPAIYDGIIQLADKELERGRKHFTEIEKHGFIKGAVQLPDLKMESVKNIMDAIIHFEYERTGDAQLEKQAQELRVQLIAEIKDYFNIMYGTQKVSAKKEAAQLLQKLWEESTAKDNLDPDSPQYRRWENTIRDELKNLKVHL
ncbi:tubulin-like doman-containing protein [Ornithinibacillus halophilus]|uniref:Tubulin like n=1 Tax=Ornithinibacillus halophilus TaxID=930117 RepID=A0A1M5GR32_9BACI|nr:tubulin-like doman-containing protein [Ornithinibacillus halophilus]SHG06205.1 Tubulin like [Ornithinibacillus halophilus]